MKQFKIVFGMFFIQLAACVGLLIVLGGAIDIIGRIAGVPVDTRFQMAELAGEYCVWLCLFGGMWVAYRRLLKRYVVMTHGELMDADHNNKKWFEKEAA